VTNTEFTKQVKATGPANKHFMNTIIQRSIQLKKNASK